MEQEKKTFWESVGSGLKWCFQGVRPLRGAAFISILVVGAALTYLNTMGAWIRTGDQSYAALVFGIELVVLVALPIVFAVNGWFNTTFAAIIFMLGIGIASINAKPALERILSHGEGIVNPMEASAKADALLDEVYGFRNPDTGERDPATGLQARAIKIEAEMSALRLDRGIVTATAQMEADAKEYRQQVSDKLAEVARLEAAVEDSRFTSIVAIVTFIVAELIRSFGLKVLVGFDAKDGRKSGRVKREFSDDEWEWLMKAAEHRKNFEEGTANRKRTKTLQIPLKDKDKQQREWWKKRLDAATHSAVSTEAIARYYFPELTVEEFPGKMKAALKKGYATQEQYDDIIDPNRAKRRAAERKAARESMEKDDLPATTNGTGAPIEKDEGDDSSIEPSGVPSN